MVVKVLVARLGSAVVVVWWQWVLGKWEMVVDNVWICWWDEDST